MILGALPGVFARKVAAFGYTEKYLTDIFGVNGVNLWNNPFSNTAMLLQLSNGGVARISVPRSIESQIRPPGSSSMRRKRRSS